MGIPVNDPGIRKLAANGLNGHLVGVFGTPPTAKKPVALPDADATRLSLSIWIPGLCPVSEANTGGRHRHRMARKAMVKGVVGEALGRVFLTTVRFPVLVTLHRIGPGRLDDDNLAHSFKAVRDTVAGWLGIDDGDAAKAVWRCMQERGKPVGTRITISEA